MPSIDERLAQIEREWREELCFGGIERLEEIQQQIDALEEERVRLIELVFPEGNKLAGEPYVRLAMELHGMTHSEAALYMRKLDKEWHDAVVAAAKDRR